MSEFINKKDVGQFFKEKTEGFEMEPPSMIWNNISENISNTEKIVFYKSWYTYLIAFVTILIFSTYFYYKNSIVVVEQKTESSSIVENLPIENTDKKLNTIVEDKEDEIINKTESKVPVIIEKINNIKDVNKEKMIKESNNFTSTTTNNSNTKSEIKKEKIYNINSSEFDAVEKIVFQNDNKENSLVIEKPVANKFGFYEINISNLKSGRYKIIIHSNNKEIEHKIEEFN